MEGLGFILLFVGAVLGVVASAVFLRRSKARLRWRLAFGLGLFVVGLVLPICLLVAISIYAEHTSPQHTSHQPILLSPVPLTQ